MIGSENANSSDHEFLSRKLEELDKENRSLRQIIKDYRQSGMFHIHDERNSISEMNPRDILLNAYFILDHQGMVREWSANASKIIGLKAVALIGENIRKWLTADPNEELDGLVTELIIDRKHFMVEFQRISDPDGNRFFYIANLYNRNEFEHMIQEFMNSMNQYRFLFEKMNEGVVIFEGVYHDTDLVNYVCIDVNPEYEKAFRVGRKEMIGTLLSDLPIFSDENFIKTIRTMEGDPYICFFEEWKEYNDRKWSITIYLPRIGELVIIFRDLSIAIRYEMLNAREKRYRELRMNMWKLAADHTILHEDELVEKLFEMVGKTLDLSRVCLNTFNYKNEAYLKYEWVKEGVPSSYKATRISENLWKPYFNESYVVFDAEQLIKMTEKNGILEPYAETVTGIIRADKINSIVFFPFSINGIPEGLLTFDWCEKEQKDWNDGEIHTGIDLKQILAMVIYKFRVENALKLSEKRYRDVVEDQIDLICRIRPNGKIIFANSAFQRFFSPIEGDIYGLNLFGILDPAMKFNFPHQIERLDTIHRETSAVVEYTKSGNQYWIQWSLQAIFDDIDHLIEIQIAGRDITDLRNTEEQLKSSLKEKEILLREVNHRVKNNLQIVSSLLKLQTYYIEDKTSIDQVHVTLNRINTISLLHQMLYSADNIGSVDMADFIPELSTQIINVYSEVNRKFNVDMEIDSMYLNLDTVINIGLIINELITNSIKHAFKTPTDDARIRIRMVNTDPYIMLEFSDNGCGFRPDFDLYSHTLGMELIKGLVGNMRGTIEIRNDNGAHYDIIWNIAEE